MTGGRPRHRRRTAAIVLTVCAGLVGGCTGGTGITISSGGVSGLPAMARSVRVDYSVQPGPQAGRQTITGYVYNDYGRSVGNVRLLVESLDAGREPADRRIFYVNGSVPAFGRAYFSFTVAGASPSYRVSLHSFEMDAGSGS